MFERKVFGRKKTVVSEPMRSLTPPSGQIFNDELFEGEGGEFLRRHGFAPDDPRNQAANGQPLSVLLAEDQQALRKALAAVNSVGDFPIVAVHLLPPALWFEEFGPWLRQQLDLSPYRPWNTIFLPGDAAGAAALGLPIASQDDGLAKLDEARLTLSCVHESFAGRNEPAVDAMLIMMSSVRTNFPALFPADARDFSPAIRDARANVRAAAFIHATLTVGLAKETILTSQATFLGAPLEQLAS